MEHLPDSNARYKDVDYWNERYRTEESFEWFGDFTKFGHLLKQHVGSDENILMLGKLDSLKTTFSIRVIFYIV